LLGRQVFGEYVMIQSTALTLGNIAQLAMGYTATKHIAEFRSIDRDRAGRILGLCSFASMTVACIAATALLAGGSWLGREILHAPQLGFGLTLAAGQVLFCALNGYQTGALAGLEAYEALGCVGIISGTVYLIMCVATGWGGGLNSLLLGLSLSAF